MSAGESFTMLMPPPCAAGDTPLAEFPLMILPLMLTAPDAKRLIPPPLPLVHLLFEITLPLI